MKVAIIGAGLSGLSLAWQLIDSGQCAVTLFDQKGIGAGASGIAAGLMHPYPGKEGKRSFLASEGIAATQRLLQIAKRKSTGALANEQGIIRFAYSDVMRSQFLAHAQDYGDVEPVALWGNQAFLIRSGMTIYCKPYLEGLWLSLKEKGVAFECKKVSDLKTLFSFDHIVLAAGAGNCTFEEAKGLRLELLKGQILQCKIPKDIPFPEQSLIGEGYIAHSEEQSMCYIGATYERGQYADGPDRIKAEAELLPKSMRIHPQAHTFPIVDCRAAFRVMRIGHYYPMAGKLKDNIWVCTALGSRGLLYHGIVAERMRDAILKNDISLLPKEFELSFQRTAL
jgi:glycine/D-amino acid oxidase-like deaminating enzyme